MKPLIAAFDRLSDAKKDVMKRTVTLLLSLMVTAIGLWVMTASQSLGSACTLSAQTGGGTSCVSGLPFDVLGIALTATGTVSVIVQLLTWVRSVRRKATLQKSLEITTLHEYEVELLRDVA
jgi:multisubunit Na+/H+ antiporter MnhB subunit